MRYREVVSPHARVVRIVTAAVFALLAGIGANREWNNWDLLRYHVSLRDVKDPEYHKDVGFYVFELPFIKFLLGWTFEALDRGAHRHHRRPLPQRRHPRSRGPSGG